MNCIEALSKLSEQPWSGRVDPKPISMVGLLGSHVVICTREDGEGLEPGHLVLALYDVISRMYNQQPGFFSGQCDIFLRKQRIGLIYTLPSPIQQVLSGSQNDRMTEPEGTEGSLSLVNSLRTLTDDSGVVEDPRDARFSISWTVDGISIPLKEIFSAAIDGIAMTAQHAYTGPCSHADGVNFSGNVGFHIGGYSTRTLLCGQIVRTFALLVRVVVRDQAKFQGMEFTLNYDENRIGSGFIVKLPSVEGHGGNGTEAVASS